MLTTIMLILAALTAVTGLLIGLIALPWWLALLVLAALEALGIWRLSRCSHRYRSPR